MNAERRTQNLELRNKPMRRSLLNSSFCVLRSAFAFLLLSCTQPPAPALAPAQPPPPAEVSTIVVPVSSSLKPLLPQLEANIPKSMSKIDAYELDPQKRFGLKYQVVRDPITLMMAC